MEEVDIGHTAQLLMKQHGDAAGSIAAQRADALLTLGDRFGSAVFRQVARAIEDLKRQSPTENL